jgi:hypothetical protein
MDTDPHFLVERRRRRPEKQSNKVEGGFHLGMPMDEMGRFQAAQNLPWNQVVSNPERPGPTQVGSCSVLGRQFNTPYDSTDSTQRTNPNTSTGNQVHPQVELSIPSFPMKKKPTILDSDSKLRELCDGQLIHHDSPPPVLALREEPDPPPAPPSRPSRCLPALVLEPVIHPQHSMAPSTMTQTS